MQTSHSHSLTSFEKEWLDFEEKHAQNKLEIKHDTASQVFENGVASWKEYYLLRSKQDEIPHLEEALDRLKSADWLFEGCTDQKFIPTVTGVEHEDLVKSIAQDNILFKMIQPKDWDEFLAQMVDYNVRPTTLRDPDGKKQATHKFRHMTGKVEDYKPKDVSQAKPQHTYTKKLATTLMARNLATTVFGESHPDRELVGLMLDRRHCRLKALLAKDVGTYSRAWVGERSNVVSYAHRAQSFNYTETDKFIQRVNENYYRTNEVLAELSREAMKAIVIARDTPKARDIARHRRKEIQDKLNITLPIVFYDNVKRTLKPYTAQQMLQDEQGINIDRERSAKARLRQLKSMISLKDKWRVYLFFNLDVKPRTAQEILVKIKQAEQDEAAEKYTWEKTVKEVKELLEQANANPSRFRSEDTADFYKHAYRQVSSLV